MSRNNQVVVRRASLAALATGAALVALPALAAAAESAPATTATVDPIVDVARFIGAAIAMGLSALGAAFAQGKIGSAAAGTLAENPDVAAMLLVLQALPEVIVLLGFVSALLIINA